MRSEDQVAQKTTKNISGKSQILERWMATMIMMMIRKLLLYYCINIKIVLASNDNNVCLVVGITSHSLVTIGTSNSNIRSIMMMNNRFTMNDDH